MIRMDVPSNTLMAVFAELPYQCWLQVRSYYVHISETLLPRAREGLARYIQDLDKWPLTWNSVCIAINMHPLLAVQG